MTISGAPMAAAASSAGIAARVAGHLPAANGTPPAGAMARAMVRAAYDRASHVYRGDTLALERTGYDFWLRRFTRPLAANARVLDLGCGNGVPVVRELARRFDVTGLDHSPIQIARARALVPGARFLCADMVECGFAAASFEGIVAFHSIINLPLDEHAPLIRRLAGWLVPGGRVLATVGRLARTQVEHDWRGVRGASMFWSHAGIDTYRAWFTEAGLAIDEEGVEPKHGNPGYAVLIAHRPTAEPAPGA